MVSSAFSVALFLISHQPMRVTCLTHPVFLTFIIKILQSLPATIAWILSFVACDGLGAFKRGRGIFEDKRNKQCTCNVTMRRVYDHCCCGKAISITYWSVCVGVGGGWGGLGKEARPFACVCERVALLIQHATRHHFAICGLSGSIIFFHFIL
jgi:hypothetical protein